MIARRILFTRCSVAGFFLGRFLVFVLLIKFSAKSGILFLNLSPFDFVLMTLALLAFIFLYRWLSFRKRKMPLAFMMIFYSFLYLLILLMLSGIRTSLFNHFFVIGTVSSIYLMMDASGAGGDANPSSSFFEGVSDWIKKTTEPGEEINSQPSQEVAPNEGGREVPSSTPGVARNEAGPSHQPLIVKNGSLEASIRNRVVTLENDQTVFLLEKERGKYWSDIKAALDQAHSQSEYNRLLEFENRDLQIRELKHSCYSLFQQVLSAHPDLAERASYNPGEALRDFFDEKRDELDNTLAWSTPTEKDREELKFVDTVGQDFRKRGRDSPYINKILGLE